MNEVAIMVAPNGARRTKADHPAIPLSPAELGLTAQACRLSGAGAIHVHVRDGRGGHALDARTYAEAIGQIGERCAGDMAVQVTTEAAGLFDLGAQVALARSLRPANLSFALRELFVDGPEPALAFLRWAAETGMAIQFILYDLEDVSAFARLRERGGLKGDGKPRVLLVVGRYDAAQNASTEAFDTLFEGFAAAGLHETTVWMTCAFGRGELACLERSIERGGHVRVGFENAVVDADGNPARDNAQRVALVADLVRRHGKAVASPSRTAAILGMRSLAPLLPGEGAFAPG